MRSSLRPFTGSLALLVLLALSAFASLLGAQRPVIDSASPTLASDPQAVTIQGSNFDASSTVTIEGVAATVLSQTSTTLDVAVPPGTPGFNDVTVTNAAGSATAFELLKLWPALTVGDAEIGGSAGIEVESDGLGVFVVAFSFQSLSAPVVLPGFYYGLLLDPTAALTVAAQGALPSSGAFSLSLAVPDDPGLDGLSIYLQAYVQQGLAPGGPLSFTNLAVATPTIPLLPPTNLVYSENPGVYEVDLPITPNVPSVTGVVDQYTVTPDLPLGLQLDAQSGVITGTPLTATAGDFVVTASNAAGSTHVTLTLATSKLFLESISVADGQIWEINRAIELAFNLPVDLGSVNPGTLSIQAGGVPAIGSVSHRGVDLDGDGFEDGTDPTVLVFQPACPVLEDLSDAGLQPGGVTYTLTVPGLLDGGPTLLESGGGALAQGIELEFTTPFSLDPAIVFFDPVVGPPAPVVRPAGSTVVDASYVELGDDPAQRLYFEVDPGTGAYTLDPADGVAPLNLYSDDDTRVRVYLFLNQPISPLADNLSEGLALQYQDGAGVWVPLQTRVEFVDNCGGQFPLVVLTPVGVLPQAGNLRVVMQAGFSDLVGDSLLISIDDFGVVPVDAPTFPALNPADGQGDELFEPFLLGGGIDGSFEDTEFVAAGLKAQWGGGALVASSGFAGTGGPGGNFDWHTPTGTLNFSTNLELIVGGPDGIPTTPVQVVNGVLDLDDLIIGPGTYLRVQGDNPLTIHATGDVVIAGTLDLSGFGAKVVGTLFAPNQPEIGAQGAAGGGRGGTGSFLTTESTPVGGAGDGPFGLSLLGGAGGEAGFDGSLDKQKRRGAGGGGGRFAADYGAGIGEAATQGGPGHPEGKGALSGGFLPAVGGLPGGGPFVDGDPTNDFWGRRGVFDGSGELVDEVVGELPTPWAGYGGGAGGDAINSDVFPTVPFGPPYLDKKGAGGAGGGGQLHIRALGRIVFKPGGRILCDGGDGATGENVLGFDHIAGSSGGGSGGHVILESAEQIDFTDGGLNPLPEEFIRARGGEGGIGFTPTIPWSKGGDGGPGVVQLHVPGGNPQTAVGTDGSALIRVPPSSGLDDLTAPESLVLLPSFGSSASARSVWIPLAGAAANPGGGLDPVEFAFGGTVSDDASPDAGKVLAASGAVDPHGDLIPATALGTAAPAPFVQPDGLTLTYSVGSLLPLIHDTGTPSNDVYLRNPDLLVDAALVLEGATDKAVFDVANAEVDPVQLLLHVSVDPGGPSLDSFLAAHGGPTAVQATLQKRFFRVASVDGLDALPSSQSIRIRFEGAEVLPDGSVGPIVQPWTADASKLSALAPGQLGFFRFQVEFDLGNGAAAGAPPDLSLGFLRLLFGF